MKKGNPRKWIKLAVMAAVFIAILVLPQPIQYYTAHGQDYGYGSTAPAVQPSAPTAPIVPAAPAPVPAPTPWTAIIISLVVAVIVGGILVWNYGFRNQ